MKHFKLASLCLLLALVSTACLTPYEKGLRYENEHNRAEAFEAYYNGAQAGDSASQYKLGWCYENGYGVGSDYDRAKEFYQLAIDNGSTEATTALAQLEAKIEAERIAEEKRKVEEARLAEVWRIAKEKWRIAEEKRKAEEKEKARLQAIEDSWKNLKESAYAEILNRYENDEAFRKKGAKALSKWITPRNTSLTQAEALEGERLLDGFADQYLPNARATYQSAREKFLEFQDKFNEVYPDPCAMHSYHEDWKNYCKFLKKLVNLRLDYLRRRDELVHFYLMHKMTLVTAEQLMVVDAKPISRIAQVTPLTVQGFNVYHTVIYDANHRDYRAPLPKEMDFASKQMPQLYAVYQQLEKKNREAKTLIKESIAAQRLMDSVVREETVKRWIWRQNAISEQLDALRVKIHDLYMDYFMADDDDAGKVQARIANEDQKIALEVKAWQETNLWYLLSPPLANVEIVLSKRVSMVFVDVDGLFFIGRYEVTQAQYEAVMGENPSHEKGDNHPVEEVSWNDAMAFCKKLNERGLAPEGYAFTLPTEKQWETAAKGGSLSKNYRYSGSNNPRDVAWYDDNSGSGTHPVGRLRPNELGIYDMSGNVWEWCLDRDRSYDNAYVYRGGHYYSDADSYFKSGHCQISSGDEHFSYNREWNLGFRVALVPVL